MGEEAGIHVRPRRASDSRVVRFIARRTWRATYEGFAPAGFIRAVLRRGYARDRLLVSLTDARRDAVVVEKDGAVVGYADLLTDERGRCELMRIYVLPAHQGEGAGRALLDATFSAARTRGVGEMAVGVDPENRAALAWYARQGFVAAGRDSFGIGAYTRPLVLLTRRVTRR